MKRRWFTPLLMMVIALACPKAWAGAFKCLQPDGSIIYQAVACAADAAGEEVPLDPRPSSGGKSRGKADDLSPEGQIKALEAARRKAHKEQAKAAAGKRQAPPRPDGPDRAKCAKHRAEAVRWHQKTKRAYRDRDDRDYQKRMLEYHQALVERYCEKHSRP